MKRFLFSISLVFGLLCNSYTNGVVFEIGKTASYLTLRSSSVLVNVENQVALTRTTQTFLNEMGDSLSVRYAFPLPEDASAIQLRFMVNSVWYNATFSATPQDTTTGGGDEESDYTLMQFLGSNPLYYTIDIKLDSLEEITVELTYVELLKYKFGKVNYRFPNDYQTIQSGKLVEESLNYTLKSERTISNISFLSHSGGNITNSGTLAGIIYSNPEGAANFDYAINYELSQEELGLYSLSTYLPDSLQKDDLGRGFFALIVEPDPSENAQVISKVFTLIIDRSGSMSGSKIVQARDAAAFIVNNLNEEDEFNIISFSSDVTAFRGQHVENSISNNAAAIDYINSLEATGLTNISEAFSTAVPQFLVSDGSKANIIIFFTDGAQTAGIQNTKDLIAHINTLFTSSEKNISLFNFGIGSNTNEQLLTSTAATNNGLAEYLGDDQLEELITEFYLMVKNPVLLNTELEMTPELLKSIYPSRLPNLYQGQQMLLVGRYDEASAVFLDLSGTAFSQAVSYEYDLQLSDSLNTDYIFLTKVWAKMKIGDLLEKYYLNLDNTDTAAYYKDAITKISLDYGVISPFTSFQGYSDWDKNGWSVTSLMEYEADQIEKADFSNKYIELIEVGPIPASDKLDIHIRTKSFVNDVMMLTLFSANGKKVYQIKELLSGSEDYRFEIDLEKFKLQPGLYLLNIQIQESVLSIKIIIN